MNRRVILVAVAACFLVTGAWYAFLWSPQSSEIQSAKAQATTAEQHKSDLEIKLRGLQSAQKRLPDLKAQLDVLRAALPDGPQLDNAIQTVQDAAKASGVEISSMSPTPLTAAPKPAPAPAAASSSDSSSSSKSTTATTTPAPAAATTATVPEIKVTIAVSGTYMQTVDFMNRLNGAPRLVVIDAVGMSGQADAAKNVKVTTSILSRFFLVPGGTK